MAFFSSKDLPNVRPVADFNFAATKILDNRINFSRGSGATYTDEMGIVRYAPNNVPRFDHNPATGECLGLLIEESRTNLVEYGDFTTGWTEHGGAATSTTETAAPDGTFTAKKITSKGDLSASGIYDSVNYTANTTYTHTMWLKAGTVTIAGLTVHTASNWASSDYPKITVNLSTGTVTSTGGVSTKLTPYPNGWYRLEATGTKNSSTGVDAIWVHSQTGSSMVGNTTDYYYVWGPQVEQGNFGSSYIPTNGSTVTRGRDIATITGTNFTNFYNQTEGTAFINALMPNPKGVAGIPAYAFKSSANSNYYYGFSRDNTGSYHYVNTSNANTFVYESLLDEYRAVLGIKTNNLNSYINDANQNVNLSTITLFDADILHLGSTTASNVLNGHIKRFTYYPKRLTDNQLQGFTA